MYISPANKPVHYIRIYLGSEAATHILKKISEREKTRRFAAGGSLRPGGRQRGLDAADAFERGSRGRALAFRIRAGGRAADMAGDGAGRNATRGECWSSGPCMRETQEPASQGACRCSVGRTRWPTAVALRNSYG